ncbi:UNVERIFIED_CONTAM: hypothetical protein FKN15_069723 [Acipenser sinensis]
MLGRVTGTGSGIDQVTDTSSGTNQATGTDSGSDQGTGSGTDWYRQSELLVPGWYQDMWRAGQLVFIISDFLEKQVEIPAIHQTGSGLMLRLSPSMSHTAHQSLGEYEARHP